MGYSSSGTPPSMKPPEDRLDSWKEIAAYLSRDVTTVQRWEKREGMPVHRHLHDRMGSVYASRAELDAWARNRAKQDNGNQPDSSVLPAHPSLPASRTRWRLVVSLAAAAVALAIGASLWLQRTEYFWRSPIANARSETVTDFGGVEQAAAVSRDGRLVAFLSDRDGPMDVWVTQVGSGEFHNLTHGSAPELANPLLRTVAFSPDGSLVTYWARRQGSTGDAAIGVWAVPSLGGQPRPYLEGAAEFDWSRDGSRLAYHTPGPGDPLFVTNGGVQPQDRPVFTAPAGLHSHFPLWAPDSTFIYLVQGS
ncbi:MAG TPA: hypothetical protein VM912_03125, partial [Terriglobales bacterium]|nr:hypothetical protein [Terriglobales bacterium]